MAESISNLSVSEGTATSSTVITFPWRARYIEIINDSETADLQYKFQLSQDYATLKPLEVVNPNIKSRTVYLNGTDLYRVRGEG